MERQASVKVPDGKLVSVRATVDGRFKDVQIRGDFFLEPPEALEDLEAAVEGKPVDTPREEFVAAFDAVDAQFIGFTADDLADAVRKVVA